VLLAFAGKGFQDITLFLVKALLFQHSFTQYARIPPDLQQLAFYYTRALMQAFQRHFQGLQAFGKAGEKKQQADKRSQRKNQK
jgi:hypothetical protein